VFLLTRYYSVSLKLLYLAYATLISTFYHYYYYYYYYYYSQSAVSVHQYVCTVTDEPK